MLFHVEQTIGRSCDVFFNVKADKNFSIGLKGESSRETNVRFLFDTYDDDDEKYI